MVNTKTVPEADMKRLDPESIRFLQEYTGLSKEEATERITSIRATALQQEMYVCIDQFRFLKYRLADQPDYQIVLDRLKSSPGITFLDAGCCFGTELRYLSKREGIPSERLFGIDLLSEYIEYGYELFNDRNTFKATFIAGSILDSSDFTPLKGKIDILTCNSFLHVFDLENQKIATKNLIKMTKGQGSMICGRRLGGVQNGVRPIKIRSGDRYVHNEESLRQFWKDVGDETGTIWEVDCGLVDHHMEREQGLCSIWWAATRSS